MPTGAPTANPRFPCNICANGGELANPDAILFTADGIPVTCGEAQAVGGIFGPGYTLQECAIAQSLAVNTCGCPGEPIPAPDTTPAPSLAPETVFCTVCFNGNPTMGAGSIGGELCQDLDKQARESFFTEQECLIIQTAAAAAEDDPCECIDPTPSPTQVPTPAPTAQPTAAPTASKHVLLMYHENIATFEQFSHPISSRHSQALPQFPLPVLHLGQHQFLPLYQHQNQLLLPLHCQLNLQLLHLLS